MSRSLEILVDDMDAVMTRATFDQLGEYSCSLPTEGVRVGDGYRWKRQYPWTKNGHWYLGEYVPPNIRKSGVLWRQIHLV